MAKERNSYIMDIEGDNGIAEVERLKRQGKLVTKFMPLLPQGGFPLKHGSVVDLGSGAGEWCLRLADPDVLGDQVEIIGVDINEASLAYCNELAVSGEKTNVEFRKMDIMQPFTFERESIDLVNARLLTGILPREYWPTLLSECYRVLKPGGMLRFIEPIDNVIENSPVSHALNLVILRALYNAGKTFSEYEYGIAAALNRIFRQSKFEAVQYQSFYLDCSAWAPLYEPMVANFTLSARQLRPLVTRFGGIGDGQFTEMLNESIEEMHKPEYANLWGLISFQARKPV